MSEKQEDSLSPFMRQYDQTKKSYPDSILFFRMGDFYEMFNDDAITVSRVLDLTLTKKRCGDGKSAPMCGVPYHSVEVYIAKLMQAGFKVAICEQVTNPQDGVKLLQRQVVRVITPGTVTDFQMLDDKKNNYLMCLYKEGQNIGVTYVDITTGEFTLSQIGDNLENSLTDLLTRVCPSEVIANDEGQKFYQALPLLSLGQLPKAQTYYDWAFTDTRADENLKRQFGDNYAKVYELAGKRTLLLSSGAVLEYINETQKRLLKHINKLSIIKNSSFLTIDVNTRRNLELVETIRDRKKQGALLSLLDKTKTSMGGRKLRKFFDEPLQDAKEINARLDAVDEFVKNIRLREQLAQVLQGISDIERLSGKLGYGNIYPKDMVSLKDSLNLLPTVKALLADVQSQRLVCCRDSIVDFSEVASVLDKALVNDPPAVLKDGGFIRNGFNTQLDEYRDALSHGKEWMSELEAKEREETGIKNLRIDQNKVFGYYIEVNKSQSGLVPLRYQRKQTISNNERYVTEDLKIIEEKIQGAKDNAIELELLLFNKLRTMLADYVVQLQKTAVAIAEIDALLSFALTAVKYNYCRPSISKQNKQIKIVDGRHPVVEAYLKSDNFIPNDTFLNDSTDRTMIITGPNMAGKSTYMRQVALIVFMAHIGSYVPARAAELPIVDRIFTRVGASDDLAFGQSTFMVEMSEVATILANATDKSLIILDEIGRGTSTFDGLAIAWSVVEYICQHFKAKTLFATHYHELTELEGVIDGVKNYKVAVKEVDDQVVFLRKIVRGGANKSFGVEVARLAGLPQEVLSRAKEISKNLEAVNTKLDLDIFKDKKDKAQAVNKKALALYNRLRDVDITRVSPMFAFDLLNDLVNVAKSEEE